MSNHPHSHDRNPSGSQPNIVFIIVDELRYPTAFPKGVNNADEFLAKYMPNLHALWQKGVKFSKYYTASSACTPARGTIVTGLYSHQTFCLLTRASIKNPQATTTPQPALNPDFQTYGKLLRTAGYDTPYIGKWHLSDGPDSVTSSGATEYLQDYGFQGLTIPDPVGLPGQGAGASPSTAPPAGSTQPYGDAQIATQAVTWLQGRKSTKPFCLTVGLVNPHDKQFFWGGIEAKRWQQMYKALDETPITNYQTQIMEQVNPPEYGYSLPDNWEAEDRKHKPKLHAVFKQSFQYMTGGIHDDPSKNGPQDWDSEPTPVAEDKHKLVAPYHYWTKALDMYTQAMTAVDTQIGQIVENIPPQFAQNTIIVFTSDHGEYASAHGLQGKAGSVYEEGIRVPFIVTDPSGRFTAEEEVVREQFVSSVDVLPMLVSMGYNGSTGWMTENADYTQMYSGRADLLSILRRPEAKGRAYALHATDEYVQLSQNFLKAPEHVLGLVNNEGKLGLYSYWLQKKEEFRVTRGEEKEYYDYSTEEGRLETKNTPKIPAAKTAYELLTGDGLKELQAPLPPPYDAARQQAIEEYWQFVRAANALSLLSTFGY